MSHTKTWACIKPEGNGCDGEHVTRASRARKLYEPKKVKKKRGVLYPVSVIHDGYELMTGIEPSERGIKIVDQWLGSLGFRHVELSRKMARKLANAILECLEDTK